MGIPDLDPRAMHGIMKMGGKKKLDTLIQLLQESGPARLKELKEGGQASEAHAAASALKASASHLGLSQLEDCCDQILDCHQWGPNAPLALQAEAAFKRAWAALQAERSRL